MKIKRKLLSFVLSLTLVFTMIPAMGSVAYATDAWNANGRWVDNHIAVWNEYPGATQYELYFSGPGISSANAWQVNGLVTSYDVTGILEEKGSGEYSFKVMAYDETGRFLSTESATLIFDTSDYAPPNPPTAAKWKISSTQMMATWIEAEGV